MNAILLSVLLISQCPGGNCPTSTMQVPVSAVVAPAPAPTKFQLPVESTPTPILPKIPATSTLTDTITKGLQAVEQCDKVIAQKTASIQVIEAEMADAQARLEKAQADLAKAKTIRASWLVQVLAAIQEAIKEPVK